jgi:hypothetical protein
MKKVALLLGVLASLCFGQGYNYTTVWDTSIIADFDSDSLKNTKAFTISRYEDAAVIVKVDDSTSAGFASDSVVFTIGYQLGYVTSNSSNAIDTTWQMDSVQLASINNSNFGVGTLGTTDSTGAVAKSMSSLDTLNVTGYAVYSKWYLPEWSGLIRYWVKGASGNVTGAPLELVIQHSQREYTNVR